MPRVLGPFRFVPISVAGWMNQRQQRIIDYLREENGFFASNSAGGGCGCPLPQRRLLTTEGECTANPCYVSAADVSPSRLHMARHSVTTCRTAAVLPWQPNGFQMPFAREGREGVLRESRLSVVGMRDLREAPRASGGTLVWRTAPVFGVQP